MEHGLRDTQVTPVEFANLSQEYHYSLEDRLEYA